MRLSDEKGPIVSWPLLIIHARRYFLHKSFTIIGENFSVNFNSRFDLQNKLQKSGVHISFLGIHKCCTQFTNQSVGDAASKVVRKYNPSLVCITCGLTFEMM